MKIRTMIAIATMALGLTAMAQPPRRGSGGGERLDQLKSYLSLTDAQVETIRQSMKDQREAMRTNMESMRAKRQALRAQMKSDNADPATLGQAMVDMKNARKSMQASRKAAADKLVATLTPEQKAKLNTLKDSAKNGGAVREAMRLGLIDPPAGAGPDGEGRRFGGPRGGRGPAMGFRGGPPRF